MKISLLWIKMHFTEMFNIHYWRGFILTRIITPELHLSGWTLPDLTRSRSDLSSFLLGLNESVLLFVFVFFCLFTVKRILWTHETTLSVHIVSLTISLASTFCDIYSRHLSAALNDQLNRINTNKLKKQLTIPQHVITQILWAQSTVINSFIFAWH